MLRLIASLRNLSQPIYKLPPEILSRIAGYVNYFGEDALSIVPLTHTCRYLRESIISTPKHWARISCRNEEMATVSLERAKTAPLEISLLMPKAEISILFPNIIIPYSQNTRNLVVRYPSSINAFAKMLPGFPQSMSALQSLVIEGHYNWDRSPDLFEQFVPPLKNLTLMDVPLYPSLLSLRSLTGFTIQDHQFDLHIDTLLDFLEGNNSLESADLAIYFVDASLSTSHRRSPIRNQLRHLSIRYGSARNTRILVSNIPLRRGAELLIHVDDQTAKLSDIFPDISTMHLSNLPGPTFLEIQEHCYTAQLLLRGPGGELLAHKPSLPEPLRDFAALPSLPLTDVREIRLLGYNTITLSTLVSHLPHSPLLEILAVGYGANLQHVLSPLLSNPSSLPSLKTLAVLNCDLSEDFMEELIEFASKRKSANTTAWIDRFLIFHGHGMFPSDTSISRLKGCVRIVETRAECGFPEKFPSCESTFLIQVSFANVLPHSTKIHTDGDPWVPDRIEQIVVLNELPCSSLTYTP